MTAYHSTNSFPALRTLVLGVGATGRSVARWLSRREQTAVFADESEGADVEAIQNILPDAKVTLGFDAVDVGEFDQIVASPGIPDSAPILKRALAQRVPVVSDVTLFVREVNAALVGVTGTNGKSTVVSLLAAMCARADVLHAAGGNLGPPVLDLPLLDDGVYLLELSSYQLHRSESLSLQAACVLNVAPDHLEWHGGFDAYRDAKKKIYIDAAYAVVNRDDPNSAVGADCTAQVLTFGVGIPEDEHAFGLARHRGATWFMCGASALLPVDDAALRGKHNHLNILAALALGTAIDLPMSAMLDAIRSFGGLPHRHQLVAQRHGVFWINDSKATNCDASLASVAAVEGDVILLAGGVGKGEDLTAFAQTLPQSVRKIIAYGANAAELHTAMTQATRDCDQVTTLEDAVTRAQRDARAGDTVLLAPAAASQDAYANYIERGEHFTQLVGRLSA